MVDTFYRKTIGGELELEFDSLNTYLTDTGRSSLRLILKSDLRNKRFLLPDYLCWIILDVFDEHKVDYTLYHVNEDLSLNVDEINGQEFDVLYVISYFGKISALAGVEINDDQVLIEDNVFLPLFEKPKTIKNWIGFNSFRKISSAAEGSLIRSTYSLPSEYIKKEAPLFIQSKYKAKATKYEYLNLDQHSESDYLFLFENGERILNEQQDSFYPSNKGLYDLFCYMQNLDEESERRKKNYELIDKQLIPISIGVISKYCCFYVIKIENRDKLRRHLFDENIFLPAHWPSYKTAKNSLCESTLSIPLDSRYTQSLPKIIDMIETFLKI